MSRWLREIKKGMIALAALTLLLQGALPVRAYAADTTEDTETREEEESDREEPDTEGSNYESSDYESSDQDSYILDYFDRIAVNSVSGKLTIRSGEDFSISFPAGGDHNPGFSVQDDILVVSGRKGGSEAEKNADGSAVILGEDEPTESGTQDAAAEALNAEGSGQKNGEKAEDLPETETVITVPSGVGLDTLRVAIADGDLDLSGITANSVTIQSGGGNIDMESVSLGTVDVYSDFGAVTVSKCTFSSINVGMAEGDVSVSADDSLERCRMELKTEDGDITYNGNSQGDQYLQPGNGKRFLTIQVGSGDISISG